MKAIKICDRNNITRKNVLNQIELNYIYFFFPSINGKY